MPVLNAARAWLETATTLKVPEHSPSSHGVTASSFIAARPGEAFSLRYDHIPVEGYDMAWKLTITGEDDAHVVEQWGGPPLEMRKSRGIVKVRAMRISEDGTRFREFAWCENEHDTYALRGTITLSLHLCHFAEATSEVPAAAIVRKAPGSPTRPHPVLAPPTTRPTGSKLWTWYWRDEEPRAIFQFNYATKETLQAEGIIPASKTGLPTSMHKSIKTPMFKTHRPRHSTNDADFASPAGLLKHKQGVKLRIAQHEINLRHRGFSNASDQSDYSSASSTDDDLSASSTDDESDVARDF